MWCDIWNEVGEGNGQCEKCDFLILDWRNGNNVASHQDSGGASWHEHHECSFERIELRFWDSKERTLLRKFSEQA